MEGGSPFERLSPSQYITFTFPNAHPRSSDTPYGDPLRIAVLDSPVPFQQQQQQQLLSDVAAMLVPSGREADWIFSTMEGHLQLLLGLSHGVSRLVLIGNVPAPPSSGSHVYTRRDSDPHLPTESFGQSLLPILYAVSPKRAFENGLPQVPFLSYEDGVVRSVVVEKAVSRVAGEMLVEDVEIESDPEEASSTTRLATAAPRDLRRRLRFRRMPNLIQTQIRILALNDAGNFDVIFQEAGGLLVQPYLGPMVAGLSLIAPFLEEQAQLGSKQRILCLGVGGGSLAMFLQRKLGFDVVGVEADDVVLSMARRHFGFTEGESLRVLAGDGIELLESFAREGLENGGWGEKLGWLQDGVGNFDAIMVDLDCVDAGSAILAPPPEFVKRSVLSGARAALHAQGILVINVVPLNGTHYLQLVELFQEVFSEVYEIDVSNGENRVLVASASPVGLVGVTGSLLRNKLEELVGQLFVRSIRKKN